MNPHEQAVLENLLDKLVSVRGTRKIPEADAMIRRAIDRQPDAAYLLVQRSLMLGQALEQAKARLAEYELGQGQGSFLDAGASGAPAMSQTMAASAPERSQASRPGLASAMPGQLPAGAPPASPEPSHGAGTAGFLGQAAATAAGVAGGAFLFQGLENLFGSHGGSAAGHDAQSFIPEDVTVNNYYGSDEGPGRGDDDRPNRSDDFEAADDDDMLSDDDNNDDDDADLI
ncbi:MAG TPA: DUF2076 domain-containing protein [Steroidobacteraceae bacterium]|nr:DUF2076 domain-containing protein [Steroidobacteraceae bacterium]